MFYFNLLTFLLFYLKFTQQSSAPLINAIRYNIAGDHQLAGSKYLRDNALQTDNQSGTGTKVSQLEALPLRPLTKDWDIGKSLNRTIETVLDEGTWINLDVSPDGKEIVFDLLGELYTLPIEGGEAKLLKGGPSFDIQPSYSPDGQNIVFTSDQSGIDNLWIIDKQGQSLRQVSDEGYRSVNNGYWSADGQQILAVKWYTSDRTIPAGTIQSYALNETLPVAPLLIHDLKEGQIGVEEPIYSPTDGGEVIYFSQNDKDTDVWNYDKDPHQGIYNIYSYNVSSSTDPELLTGGVGGAGRPTPSRDGMKLAFVRRIEFKWGLVVKDLESGDETIIWDGLSRDSQESAAMNGVYPRFSWLPDDSAIIIWAKGKIYRVPMDHSPIRIIPFKAKLRLNIAPTVKHEYDLIEASEDETFDSKAIQYFDVDSQGAKVVYIVTGQTYIKNLQTGESILIQVPNPEDNRHAPSFHPTNDNIIIQSRWNDTGLSYIEIIDIEQNKVISTLDLPKGHYTYPSLSNNGKRFTFIKTIGDEICGILFSTTKLGVWVGELDDKYQVVKGSLKLAIPNESSRPRFSKDDKKLLIAGYSDPYLYGLESEETESLGTIQDNSGDVILNPDGTIIAFTQYRHIYIAPAKANTTYWSKPGNSTEGLIRLSKDGGQYTMIGGPNSEMVYYLMANTLFEIRIATVQSNCRDIAKSDDYFGYECVQPLLKSYNLSVQVPVSRPPSDKILVLDNANIVTMRTGNINQDIIERGRLVIQGNKILAIGVASRISIPAGAEVKNLQGSTILPGFMDEHAHWSGFDYPVRSHWQHQLALSYGVTTMHNPSYDTVQGFVEQELVRSGRLLAPRIFTTGTILYGAGSSVRVEVNNYEDAKSVLRLQKSYGAISVKSYNQPSRYSRQMILQAARELGMLVVPEGGMHFTWNTNQIIDGHTTLEHSLSPGIVYEDLRFLFEKSGTAWTPTLVVSFGGISGETYWYQSTNVWEDPKMRQRHPLKELESASFRRTLVDEREHIFLETGLVLTNLTHRNVLINPGAHGQRQGIGYLWELWMFSKSGFTNYEVLRSATRNVAKTLGLKDLGSLEVGKLADYVIYPPGASPMEDLKYLHNITQVSINGFLYETSSLDQIWPEQKKALPLPKLNNDYIIREV